MKSLFRRITGQSTSRSNRANRQFRPRCQALESRLLLAGPDSGDPGTGMERDPQQATVESTTTSNQQTTVLPGGLRRLSDLQVTIEVRFISLQDNFFERIGVDFDFDIDDNVGGPVDPLGEVDHGPTLGDGLGPTPDSGNTDLIFGQSSIGAEVPGFDGFDPAAAKAGFAILSDIEVFLFMQAAQADNRADGDRADMDQGSDDRMPAVGDTENRPFVMSVIPVG